MKKLRIRRADREKSHVGGFDDGVKRYYDQVNEQIVVKIFSGDCYVTPEKNELMVTILGSCVAACARDPMAKVAGMNHFLLPGDYNSLDSDYSSSARYGVYAMEKLINEIIKLGGAKSRIELKLFGGGNVINNSSMIGEKNAKFARDFAKREGLKLISTDLGGDWPRRVHFFSETGKAMVRKLHRKEDLLVIDKEQKFSESLRVKPVEGDVELF